MIKKFLFGAAFLVAGLAISAEVFAIGMITEPIVIKDIIRGGEISKTVTVFNPQSDEVVYSLGSSGAIKGWVEFFEEGKSDAVTTVVVPPKKYYDITAKIKVPEGTPNGEYAGEIYVKQDPKEQPKSGESSVAIAQMVSREVKITVTDKEIVEFHATLIPEFYDVAAGDPLKIKIIYENTGNVSVKPNFQLKVVSNSGEKTVFNAIYPYSETEEAVKPGERKTMSIFEWPTTGQTVGSYRAETVFTAGEGFSEKSSFRFSIGNQSFGKGKVLGAFISSIGGGKTGLGWVVFIAALAVLAFGLVIVFVKRRKAAVLQKE